MKQFDKFINLVFIDCRVAKESPNNIFTFCTEVSNDKNSNIYFENFFSFFKTKILKF